MPGEEESADGDELVADAALADDAPGGLRVILQLLAEAADVPLEVVDLVGVLAAPHLGQQGVVRKHPSRVAGQVVEEGVFGWREPHRPPADGDGAAGGGYSPGGGAANLPPGRGGGLAAGGG